MTTVISICCRVLGNTLIITFFAIILSVILGTLIAIVRARHERKGDWKIQNMLCQLYLTMRGTPTMVQLLIIYYVVFASADVNKILVAVIAFGELGSLYCRGNPLGHYVGG